MGDALKPEPAVVRERDWEAFDEGSASGAGSVLFKTLISGGLTRSETLTLGIAKVPPGGGLREHRHRQAEVYLVLSGESSVRVGAEERPVEAGRAVFVPGDAEHACTNTGTSELRFAYALAADSFEEVEYLFAG